MYGKHKKVDTYSIYWQLAFAILLIFFISYLGFQLISQTQPHNTIRITDWQSNSFYHIYEKGITSHDIGMPYVLQSHFTLESVFSIENPELLIVEGIIPTEIELNGIPLHITHIERGAHNDTYLIGYKIPVSALNYINTITVHYQGTEKVGWLQPPIIGSDTYVHHYIFIHRTLYFLSSYVNITINIIAIIILTVLYVYFKNNHLILLLEGSILFLFSYLFSSQLLSITYFLPILIYILILEQLSFRHKNKVLLILELLLIGISLLIPLFTNHHNVSYPLIRSLIGITFLILISLYFSKNISSDTPVFLWLFVSFGLVTLESIIQLFSSNHVPHTEFSVLFSSISAILLGIVPIYQNIHWPYHHPHELILMLKEQEISFCSIYIRSHTLARDTEILNELLIPHLCIKDSYAIYEDGIWIIKPDTVHEETIMWVSNIITKVRYEHGIKDVRIGVVEIPYPSQPIVKPSHILNKSRINSELAHYPDFNYITELSI